MDIKQLASQLMAEKFGGKVSSENASEAISDLLGDAKGNLDLGGIVSKMTGNSNLSNVVQSWLGDGDNEGIQASQLTEIFDGDKLSGFAKKLGVSTEEASNSLSEILPGIIDKSSSGGNLLDNLGGLGGVMNMAKGLFK
ncbi:MAG: YidB family protein [Pseudomonadales bacterium]